ncbi:MAG: hypothetical protein KatS3mg017_0121 [Fimbriimonadales bacterium]|nr:MAG: hypothetical protein KatS3mg017_0121 [Fimbriimonadales bacterium]
MTEALRNILFVVGLFVVFLGMANQILLTLRFATRVSDKKVFVADSVLSVVAILAGIWAILKSEFFSTGEWLLVFVGVMLSTVAFFLLPFSIRSGSWSRWKK